MDSSLLIFTTMGGLALLSARDQIVLNLAERLFRSGRTSVARKILRMALVVPLMPWDSKDIRGCLVGLYAEALGTGEGVMLLSDFLEKNPQLNTVVEATMIYSKVRILSALNRHQDIYELVSHRQQIINQNPELRPSFLCLYLLSGFMVGRSAEVEPAVAGAVQHAREYDKQFPPSEPSLSLERSIHGTAGLIYRVLSRFEEAEQHLLEGMRLFKGIAQLELLADTYLQMGDLERARQSFDEALELGGVPGCDHVFFLVIGESEKALSLFNQYVERNEPLKNSDNSTTLASLRASEGVLYLEAGNLERAMQAFQKAVKYDIARDYFAAYSTWLARAEAGQGQVQDALARLDSLKPISEELKGNTRLQSELQAARVEVLFQGGEYLKVLELAPESVQIASPIQQQKVFYQWALSCRALGDETKTKDLLQRAYDSAPGYQYAELALKELESI